MSKINFSFQGWVSAANVTTITVVKTGKKLDVSDKSSAFIAKHLKEGEWAISLGDYLYDNHKDVDIEILDYDTD